MSLCSAVKKSNLAESVTFSVLGADQPFEKEIYGWAFNIKVDLFWDVIKFGEMVKFFALPMANL